MGISRQAYYQCIQAETARGARNKRIVDFVQYQRLRQPRMGVRKLHHLLHEQMDATPKLGRDQLFDVLREQRLLVARPRAFHKTTHSLHRFYKHPNLLKPGPDQVIANGPEQVWVADIAYLPTRQGTTYLSLVTDAWSRKIVGYHVHDTLHATSVRQAFSMALKGRQSRQALVHHSDRGIQYCSRVYQQLHERHGIRCSMTDGYDCYQNALAERVNGILKCELLLQRPHDLLEARKMVMESVTIYNQERPHLALKYKTPDAMHRAF